MRREEAILWVTLATLATGAGWGMREAQRYFSEDWREVENCSSTYWVCEATATGKSRLPVRGRAPTFLAEAKACEEFGAYETALRRALFDCSMGGTIVGGSCRELQTDCAISSKQR